MNKKERFVWKMAEWLGLSPQNFIESLAAEKNLELPKEYIDPVYHIHELRDDPTTCYIWIMNQDTSTYQMQQITDNMYSEFVRKYGRDPNALHLIVNSIDEIQNMEKEALERIVVPWIQAGRGTPQQSGR